MLLFRMGDFYELFDEDAKMAARELDLPLTSRDKGTNLRLREVKGGQSPMAKSSPFWPWIKRIAKVATGAHKLAEPVTGGAVSLGVDFLVDVQDEWNKAEPKERDAQLRAALTEIHADTKAILATLANEYPQLQPDDLRATNRHIAEAVYRKSLADELRYADFKGITQLERFVSLELDEVFVDLKARPEKEGHEILSEMTRMRAQLDSIKIDSYAASVFAQAIGYRYEDLQEQLDQLDGERLRSDHKADPVPIDHLFRRSGGVVLLGGPGSGKTTLVKRIARSCAHGIGFQPVNPTPDSNDPNRNISPLYPAVADLFPVVVSITLFDDARGPRELNVFGLLEYIEARLEERWGPALVEAFREQWAAGRCLLLLDGLDEVADVGRRIGAARAVDGLLQKLGDNRLLVTSRIIGYSICRLSAPADHATLEPFSQQDVEQFARQWWRAYERSAHPESPRLDYADREAQALIDEIRRNPRVAELATNPLMLTLIALIKHQSVTLPDRRVELYEKALETLILSWNKARSLSGRPVGETPRVETTKKVWSTVAFWMHGHSSRGTLRRRQLLDKLVEVLTADGESELRASEIAESYLQAATESSGLLEARGQDQFAFVHQTFQEYLAAIRLATLCRKNMDALLPLIDNPRWHEVIRLAAGYIGVQLGDSDQLSELIQTLLDESRDPLEPYLLTGLRLAASCIADDVGYRQRDSDAVIERLFDRAENSPFKPLQDSLGSISLAGIKSPPSLTLRPRLLAAYENAPWHAEMHAVRLLGLAQSLDDATRQHFESLLDKNLDLGLKFWAALGLWHAGVRRDEAVIDEILHGLMYDPAVKLLQIDANLAEAFAGMLEHRGSIVQLMAAHVLGGRGEQARVRPVLIRLLEDEDLFVRLQAAETLGDWGEQEAALPTLIGLLECESVHVRYGVAEILGRWGQQTLAQAAAVQLLEDNNSRMRLWGAELLGKWGEQAKALSTVVQLFGAGDIFVQSEAANLLSGWGEQATARAAFVQGLDDNDSTVRMRAAVVLGGWGEQDIVRPVLIQLLEVEDQDVHKEVIRMLGGWGSNAELVAEVLQLLAPRAKQAEREAVIQWLTTRSADGENPRSQEVSEWIAKHLKPQPRDSAKKKALRQVLYHMTWNAAGR